MLFYNDVLNKINKGEKLLAVLLDPDKFVESDNSHLLKSLSQTPPDIILVGGSLVTSSVDLFIDTLKKSIVNVPIVLFPGNYSQFTQNADALLYLLLISGRNPEYLIGQHVLSAYNIKKSGVEVISTGYILIDGGRTTSVQYVSNTMPIPADKTDLAVATAIAGELIGNKMIYLEAGSGALNHVPEKMISEVKHHLSIPLIVGGGLRDAETVKKAFVAGADIVVIGNILETNPEKYDEILNCKISL